MRVAFRTDASLEIGTGHVMRCLTLADALRRKGAECLFVCRPHCGHLIDNIQDRGHRVVPLPEGRNATPNSDESPAHASWLGADWWIDGAQTREALGATIWDWLVVDHYALDERWERALRPACRHLMVMDDLADRDHDCDLILDPSLGRVRGDYEPHIASSTSVLLGPRYALLRPEFAALRPRSLARRKGGTLRHLLITMGGVDKDNTTGRVLDALDAELSNSQLRITVVMGSRAPWLKEVRAQASRMGIRTNVLIDVENMASLMADSDLAIGAAGGTSWERCCLGLPAFTFCLAPNQRDVARALQDAGAAVLAENPAATAKLLAAYLKSGEIAGFLTRTSEAAAKVTNGMGAERTCEWLQI